MPTKKSKSPRQTGRARYRVGTWFGITCIEDAKGWPVCFLALQSSSEPVVILAARKKAEKLCKLLNTPTPPQQKG